MGEPATVEEGSPEGSSAGRARGLPGGRVVAGATVVVVVVAGIEVLVTDRIGAWTGGTLVAVSVIAALVTRAGDRSLPAMMPPLAFLAAALVAGQALVVHDQQEWWVRQGAMLVDVLGVNAVWVVVATALAVLIGLVRHVLDRRRS